MGPLLGSVPTARRVLAAAVHPDDIESWCAGTLAGLIEAGAVVSYLLLTSGDKGVGDPALSLAEAMALREAEQRQAAAVLGVQDVVFLRREDGELADSRALRGEVVREIRRIRPDLVFTHDPEHPYPPYTTHRDHRVAGRVVLDAVYPAARDARSFPEHLAEGLRPHSVREVWLYSSAIPDTWIDVAATREQKIAARLAHCSQTPDLAALASSWRERAARVGEPVGLLAARRSWCCAWTEGFRG